ncbi:MAG: hypothetical protein LBI42_11750 [Chitinispirillales bacterium]|jgi:hypothetical protein|nr:hypothetical protein [Chitinispirillales bacterium]
MLKIGIYTGCTATNVGNAFFDMGAKQFIQEAFPSAKLFILGGVTHWMFNHSQVPPSQQQKYSINSLEMAELAKIDLIVFAGMRMCKEFVDNNGRSFLSAAKRGVAFLGLGVGASEYTNFEAKYYSDFLSKLGKVAIITRDDNTYSMFKEYVKNIVSGIDCAFALSRYYEPPHLDFPNYDVVTFDSSLIPTSIDHEGRDILYAHHNLLGGVV